MGDRINIILKSCYSQHNRTGYLEVLVESLLQEYRAFKRMLLMLIVNERSEVTD